ncbi:MAG: AMP-binding protein [Bdellovibrionales bacterium]|nr:AMP-binding protein [Bdellovibrionales bacterium]
MRDSSTILHRLYLWSQDQPQSPAHHFRTDSNHWASITAKSFWIQVVRVALYLRSREFGKGDRALIYAMNSPEWIQWELGVILAGGMSVGIHPSLPEGDLRQVVEEVKPKIVLVESDLYRDTLLQVDPEIAKPMTFIEGAQQVILSSSQDEVLVDARGVRLLDGIDSKAAQFVVYTSGTMGKPKGVMLSLDHFAYVAESLAREWNLPFMQGELFSFLPLAHVAEKIQTIAVAISLRYPVWFNSRYERFMEELREVRPTMFLAVPRVWERIREGVETQKPKVFQLLKEIEKLGQIAEKLYLSQIKEHLGMDRLLLAVSGAAKLSGSIGQWFKGIGIEIQEIYGLSESAGLITLTHKGREDFRLLGRAPIGTEIKITQEGEIWIKGPQVFLGYLDDKEATDEVLLEDGWLKTGDLGEWKPGPDGSPELNLIGRNREIIKLSNGKMVAPVPIENALKSIPEASNVCVVGESRSELLALITLKESVLLDFRFIPGAIEGLTVEDDAIKARVQEAIDQMIKLKQLSYPVKKFVLLSREFSVEKGELTPTQKLNRRQINHNFKHFIELYYA